MRLLYLYGEEITGRKAREIHTLNRVLSLARCGVEVTLVTAYDHSEITAKSELLTMSGGNLSGIEFHSFSRQWKIGGVSIKSSAHFYHQVGGWIKKQNSFDVVYGIHLKAAAFIKKSFPKLPFVFESHELFSDAFDSRSWRYRKLCTQEQSVYQKVEAVVSTSHYLLTQIEKSFSIPKSRLVSPNCAEACFFEWDLERADSKELIYLGSFQQWKGVSNAIQAMKLLPDFHLTIVGGSDREIEALRREAPVNVRFLGFLPHDQVQAVMERASIALIPNRLTPVNSLQTFPMKLVEYAAAGKKIVTTDLPILKELRPGDWCSRVPADQPEAIARSVKEQALKVQDRFEIREWARSFQWEPQAERIRLFIAELLVLLKK